MAGALPGLVSGLVSGQGSGLPSVRDLAELVRLPASLTVPGDVWSGAACLAAPPVGGAGAMPLASVLLYCSGMALNDWADRGVDAVERPERLIPSGRMPASTALGVAAALASTGLALTAVSGGWRATRVSIPLVALVATYDLLAKDSPLGPVVMASTRGLDVLLGATQSPAAALAPAAAIATHTAGVTLLSRGEVHGTGTAASSAALAATAAAAAAVVVATLRDGSARPLHRACAVALAAAYVVTVGGAQARTLSAPDAPTVRRATGAGIGGLTLLQAAWLASRGRPVVAAAVTTAGPLLRRAARRVSPT
jgi:4-hydroxybenzoate polyprenyltransferase